MSPLDRAHHQIGYAAYRVSDDYPFFGRPGEVVLIPGAYASATLRTESNDWAGPAACRPAQAALLRVYPPGNRKPIMLDYPYVVCTSESMGDAVGPVRSGKGFAA